MDGYKRETWWLHRDATEPLTMDQAIGEVAEVMGCCPTTVDEDALDFSGYERVFVFIRSLPAVERTVSESQAERDKLQTENEEMDTTTTLRGACAESLVSLTRALAESQSERDRLDAENKRLSAALAAIEYFDAVTITSKACFLIVPHACYEIPVSAVFMDRAQADRTCEELNRRWHDSDGDDGYECWVEEGRISESQIAIWHNALKDPPETVPDLRAALEGNSD